MSFKNKAAGKQVALEEDATGVAGVETEYVFYAFVKDFEQLKNAASKIHQEQWEIKVPRTDKNATSGGIRVRKVIEDGKPPQYCLTTKVAINAEGDKDEVTTETSSDMFVHFAFLSQGGMIKDRYVFPIEGTDLKWEVDMFLKSDGSYHNWCKIDLEVPSRDTEVPTEMPITFSALINGDAAKRSEAESKKISELYSQFFLTPNRYMEKDPEVI